MFAKFDHALWILGICLKISMNVGFIEFIRSALMKFRLLFHFVLMFVFLFLHSFIFHLGFLLVSFSCSNSSKLSGTDIPLLGSILLL